MKGSLDSEFKHVLKTMIIEACDKDVTADDVPDDDPLFGDASVLKLDSVDGLQLSILIQKRFGIRIADPKEMRRRFTSINAIADMLQPE